MNPGGPLAFGNDLSQLPSDRAERHEVFVDFFGQFLIWLRNSSLQASRKFIESDEWREKLGAIRCRYYEGVARMPPEQREAAMLLVEETLNGFTERLTWLLGDEGTDARMGSRHAYRFRVEMEIVDVETGELVEVETINRGGKFFGANWGRWLNRYSSQNSAEK
jgi:hypothetical protein